MNEVINSSLVEALRFGSSIPGGYWGCCAGDIIQCFKSMPDEPASCQSVNGDSGYPQTNSEGEDLFFGPTNKDLFLQRLRVGTFGTGDMEDHFFLIVLEHHQLHSAIGKAWLPIIKGAGFEFIRTTNNSVWTKTNYMFGLFRNSSHKGVKDQFTPPKAWTDLPSNGKTELWEFLNSNGASDGPAELTKQHANVDKAIWDKIGPAKLLTEAEVIAAGAPVILAGQRAEYPQEEKSVRDERDAAKGKKKETSLRAEQPMPQI